MRGLQWTFPPFHLYYLDLQMTAVTHIKTVPSNDTICMYRSRQSEISYERIEKNEYANLAAGNHPDVDTSFVAFDENQLRHNGSLLYENGIRNSDETADNCSFGKQIKAFISR